MRAKFWTGLLNTSLDPSASCYADGVLYLCTICPMHLVLAYLKPYRSTELVTRFGLACATNHSLQTTARLWLNHAMPMECKCCASVCPVLLYNGYMVIGSTVGLCLSLASVGNRLACAVNSREPFQDTRNEIKAHLAEQPGHKQGWDKGGGQAIQGPGHKFVTRGVE